MTKSAVDIYLINLDRSPDRLAFQKQQFGRLGLDFIRVPAVDGRSIDEDAFQRHAYLWERPLSRTEVACILSHRACWQRIAAAKRPGIVLEDDAVLGSEIHAFIEESSRFSEPIAINLETRSKDRFLSKRPAYDSPGGSYRLFELMLGVTGATAYFVTPAAAELLEPGVDRHAPIADIYVWNAPELTKLQSDPGLALQLESLKPPTAPDTAYRTTISRPLLGPVNSVAELFRHPVLRMRRVAGQVRLGFKKLLLTPVAERRIISPSPSIAKNYRSLQGHQDG